MRLWGGGVGAMTKKMPDRQQGETTMFVTGVQQAGTTAHSTMGGAKGRGHICGTLEERKGETAPAK